MMLKKKQAMLYEAVGNIDSRFIEETINAPVLFVSKMFKRVASMVAIFSFVLTVFIYFSTEPRALITYQTQIFEPEYDVELTCTNVTPESISQIIDISLFPEGHNLFCINFSIKDPSEEMCDSAYMEISYDGVTLSSKHSNDHLIITDQQYFHYAQPNTPNSGILLSISAYGWFDYSTVLTASVYYTSDTTQKPIIVQTMEISFLDDVYIVNGESKYDSVSAKVRSMSTEALVDSFLREDYLPNLGYTSSTKHFHSILVANNPETWIELNTRPDAGKYLLRKLRKLKANDPTSSKYTVGYTTIVSYMITIDDFYTTLTWWELLEAKQLVGFDFTSPDSPYKIIP